MPDAVSSQQLAIDFAYLVTGVCFILGLRYLSNPKTARLGNTISMAGMAIALIATGFNLDFTAAWWILLVGAGVGAAVGIYSARAVKMTAMPQMVALFNGAGGGAAAMVATAEYLGALDDPSRLTWDFTLATVLSSVIGAISFTGSIVAFLKLQELMTGRPITYPGQQVVNALIALAIVVGAGLVIANYDALPAYFVALGAAALLGVLFVLPIGGADMPVIISLLNSFTGLAAAMTGFVLGNNVLIISGALVGASGTLLTTLMGKAMNRSITNVLFGGFGAVIAEAGAGNAGGVMREISLDDAAMQLAFANRVVFVPGYGLATAQAQHACRELGELLESRGVTVKYAIHPVAGRMPGHMNVLLAEANVPYSSLYEMEQINPEFPSTDVAVVIGANDVVNPDARDNPKSIIAGMPILEVDRARSVIVLKRGQGRGFSGLENPLFFKPCTTMLYGDAKSSLSHLAQAVQHV